MKLTEKQLDDIQKFTGYSFSQIMDFTDGEFVRYIYRLFFNRRISGTQYLWLKAMRGKHKRSRNSRQVNDVIDVLGGEVL